MSSTRARLLGMGAAALVALWGGLCFAEARLVPVNGHQLYLDCRGSAAGPTVILEAGGGGTTEVWNKVQPAVAAFARICSYDRAGLGKSSALEEPQTADEIADDLAALLKNAQVPPPYLLVGHSIGGIYVRKFDARWDSLVSGMVLVDSSHEEQIWRFAKDMPEALSEYPDWQDAAAMRARGFLPAGERLQWSFTKPLFVIEHGVPPEPVWHAMQVDLGLRSPKGKLITAEKSSHYIQKIQPELVIEAIREVWKPAGQP